MLVVGAGINRWKCFGSDCFCLQHYNECGEKAKVVLVGGVKMVVSWQWEYGRG